MKASQPHILRLLLVIIGMYLSCVQSARWIGQCGDYHDASRWDVGHVPNPDLGESAEFLSNGLGMYSVSITQPNTRIQGSLTISNARVIVKADLNITSVLVIQASGILDLSYSSGLRIYVGGVNLSPANNGCTIRFRCSGIPDLSPTDSVPAELAGCSSFIQTTGALFVPGCSWQIEVENLPPESGTNWLYVYSSYPTTSLLSFLDIHAEWSYDILEDAYSGLRLDWNTLSSGESLDSLPEDNCSLSFSSLDDFQTPLEFSSSVAPFLMYFDLAGGPPDHLIYIKDACLRTLDTPQLLIRFNRLIEQTDDGTIVQMLDFKEQIFLTFFTQTNLTYETSFIHANTSLLDSLFFNFQVFSKHTSLSFAGIDFGVDETMGKWSLSLSHWTFVSLNNSLILELDILLDPLSSFRNISAQKLTSDSVTYVLYTSDFLFHMILLNRAQLTDDMRVNVTHSCQLVNQNVAKMQIVFPAFTGINALEYDPIFSVLLNQGTPPVVKECSSDAESDNAQVIIIIASVCAAFFLLLIVMTIASVIIGRFIWKKWSKKKGGSIHL